MLNGKVNTVPAIPTARGIPRTLYDYSSHARTSQYSVIRSENPGKKKGRFNFKAQRRVDDGDTHSALAYPHEEAGLFAGIFTSNGLYDRSAVAQVERIFFL